MISLLEVSISTVVDRAVVSLALPALHSIVATMLQQQMTTTPQQLTALVCNYPRKYPDASAPPPPLLLLLQVRIYRQGAVRPRRHRFRMMSRPVPLWTPPQKVQRKLTSPTMPHSMPRSSRYVGFAEFTFGCLVISARYPCFFHDMHINSHINFHYVHPQPTFTTAPKIVRTATEPTSSARFCTVRSVCSLLACITSFPAAASSPA